MSQREFVSYEGVKKTYDGKDFVVRGLDLHVKKGEFLTLLGPSGSGKTTTLMMLAGFEAPTSGEIYLDGCRIDQMPAHRRDIGVVFQNYALFPHMTVAENIAFPLHMRGVNSTDTTRRVSQALDNVRLSALSDRRPTQLSGGQQQRVALARALIFEPKLVLMDEPLGALDKQLREHMQLEIKQLHARLGVTIVYVTHDQGEALTMSDRVGVFNDGLLQQLAPPTELYDAPANPFIAQFIGENNAIGGSVVEIRDSACCVLTPDNERFWAMLTPGVGVGSRVSLSLRPEKIRFSPEDTTGLNMTKGAVADVVYYGDHVRLRVKGCGCEGGLLLKVVNAGRLTELAPGTEVVLGWDPEDCRALLLH
ncbi:ABC transporter ATP-binding protein [Polaromonas sp.]|uniref:ABC transporter ATP-binding protein n=1 Tax=Polaromonas sp. TaxID=1869339 RepID=UPI00326740C5